MPFKLDYTALILDTFTLGCWSGYWNIQKILKSNYNINVKRSVLDFPNK